MCATLFCKTLFVFAPCCLIISIGSPRLQFWKTDVLVVGGTMSLSPKRTSQVIHPTSQRMEQSMCCIANQEMVGAVRRFMFTIQMLCAILCNTRMDHMIERGFSGVSPVQGCRGAGTADGATVERGSETESEVDADQLTDSWKYDLRLSGRLLGTTF